MSGSEAELTVRRATLEDLPRIFALAQRSLGWEATPETERHFAWKHFENPFGPSDLWVADTAGRLVGLRTFLRWELVTVGGEVRRAARAVDTGTDPDHQRRGIFTRLTTTALDALRADGVDFVFNTPNAQSQPGNLKLGWRVVGRLPTSVRPTGPRGLAALVRARTPATRGAVASDVGEAAAVVFADAARATALLRHTPGRTGLSTHRTAAYLAWRFGHATLHYRVVAAPPNGDAAAVVFHLRRRGPALEAVVCEAFAPAGEPRALAPLYRRIARDTGADYLIRLGRRPAWPGADGFWPLPRVGPVLTSRAVNRPAPADPGNWDLTMGDIEGF